MLIPGLMSFVFFLLFYHRHLVALERSTLPLVLLPLTVCGGFTWALPLRPRCGLVLHKNSSNGLLSRSVICGDVQELTGVARLLTPQLVDQCFAAGAGKEGADHVEVDDVGE